MHRYYNPLQSLGTGRPQRHHYPYSYQYFVNKLNMQPPCSFNLLVVTTLINNNTLPAYNHQTEKYSLIITYATSIPIQPPWVPIQPPWPFLCIVTTTPSSPWALGTGRPQRHHYPYSYPHSVNKLSMQPPWPFNLLATSAWINKKPYINTIINPKRNR